MEIGVRVSFWEEENRGRLLRSGLPGTGYCSVCKFTTKQENPNESLSKRAFHVGNKERSKRQRCRAVESYHLRKSSKELLKWRQTISLRCLCYEREREILETHFTVPLFLSGIEISTFVLELCLWCWTACPTGCSINDGDTCRVPPLRRELRTMPTLSSVMDSFLYGRASFYLLVISYIVWRFPGSLESHAVVLEIKLNDLFRTRVVFAISQPLFAESNF